ncbi:MAG TPA: MarR family transcriptional regulator [Gammaproteobacteria bacterium]
MIDHSGPERSLGFLLTDVFHLMRRSLDRRLQSLGLTQAQWRAIAHLARHQGMNQAALAERLEVQPITLARLVDRMEAAGWVERARDPDDRRAVRLYLTDQCRPILAEMHERASQMLEEALAGVSDAARRRMVEELCRIKENLSAAEAAARGLQGKDQEQDTSENARKRRNTAGNRAV